MFTRIVISLICALLLLTSTQCFGFLENSPVNVHGRVWLTSHAVNFHDEQWTTNVKKTMLDVGLTLRCWQPVLLKYTASLPVSHTETFTPIGYLKIGATEFSDKATGSQVTTASGSSQKLVNIDYGWRGAHRFELCLPSRYQLSPLIIADYPTIAISGQSTGTGSSSQTLNDTETFSQLFMGAGAVGFFPIEYATAEIRGAFSDRYSFVSGGIVCPWNRDLYVLVGYDYRTYWFTDKLRLRLSGPFIGLELRFRGL